MGTWRLRLLGAAHLEAPSGERVALEGRTAGALAHVAMEGVVPKLQLASLLWPESSTTTMRNNMRQLVRRLRVATGARLLAGDTQHLELAPGVEADVLALKAAALGGPATEPLAPPSGMLLPSYDLDECPEFARWLDGARLAVEGWKRRAREQALRQREHRGEWEHVRTLLQSWQQEEPESEEAARALMRAHYVLGERSAALAVYERVRASLARELDVTPSEETRRLWAEIQRAGPASPRVPSGARPPLPLTLLRPPRFVGRERVWQELEEGWRAGQLLVISGDSGIGKSRLAEEFAASKGAWYRAPGQLGDRHVPFSSRVRALRWLRARHPEVELPEWVRHELSSLMPELRREEPVAQPAPAVTAPLRLLDAQAEALRMLTRGYAAVVVDDIQYCDPASIEAVAYALAQGIRDAGSRLPLRYICCYRPQQVPSAVRSAVAEFVAAGLARLVELEPLSEGEVQALIESLELPRCGAHVAPLARYTGGNPLFVVEMLRHLHETGQLEGPWPEPAALPERVRMLLDLRLQSLSEQARHLAEVAALAGAHYSPELAADVLQTQLASVWRTAAELEAAQVMTGERFSHDLLQEAVASLAPASLRRRYHAALAAALERRGAAAAVVAYHRSRAEESEGRPSPDSAP